MDLIDTAPVNILISTHHRDERSTNVPQRMEYLVVLCLEGNARANSALVPAPKAKHQGNQYLENLCSKSAEITLAEGIVVHDEPRVVTWLTPMDHIRFEHACVDSRCCCDDARASQAWAAGVGVERSALARSSAAVAASCRWLACTGVAACIEQVGIAHARAAAITCGARGRSHVAS